MINKILECYLNPCQNGGMCVELSYSTSYSCVCSIGFYGVNCQYSRLNSTIFVNSTILTNEQSIELVNLITMNKGLTSITSPIKLIFQARVNGFNSTSFHANCDGVLGTLFVAKSSFNNNIFGGYTEADWSGLYQYKNDPYAFLFSLTNIYNTSVKMPVTNSQNAIYTFSEYGPTFGNGYDAYFDSSLNFFSYHLGYSYQLPSFLTMYSQQTQSFLAGSYSVQPFDVEVYSIFIDRKFIFILFNLLSSNKSE